MSDNSAVPPPAHWRKSFIRRRSKDSSKTTSEVRIHSTNPSAEQKTQDRSSSEETEELERSHPPPCYVFRGAFQYAPFPPPPPPPPPLQRPYISEFSDNLYLFPSQPALADQNGNLCSRSPSELLRPDLDGHAYSNESEGRRNRASARDEIDSTLHVPYCALCGRRRSKQYLLENPVEPGVVPVPGICSRCIPPTKPTVQTNERQIEEILIRRSRTRSPRSDFRFRVKSPSETRFKDLEPQEVMDRDYRDADKRIASHPHAWGHVRLVDHSYGDSNRQHRSKPSRTELRPCIRQTYGESIPLTWENLSKVKDYSGSQGYHAASTRANCGRRKCWRLSSGGCDDDGGTQDELAYCFGVCRELLSTDDQRRRHVKFASPVENEKATSNPRMQAVRDWLEEIVDQRDFEKVKERVRADVHEGAGPFELDGHRSEALDQPGKSLAQLISEVLPLKWYTDSFRDLEEYYRHVSTRPAFHGPLLEIRDDEAETTPSAIYDSTQRVSEGSVNETLQGRYVNVVVDFDNSRSDPFQAGNACNTAPGQPPASDCHPRALDEESQRVVEWEDTSTGEVRITTQLNMNQSSVVGLQTSPAASGPSSAIMGRAGWEDQDVGELTEELAKSQISDKWRNQGSPQPDRVRAIIITSGGDRASEAWEYEEPAEVLSVSYWTKDSLVSEISSQESHHVDICNSQDHAFGMNDENVADGEQGRGTTDS